jgi:hypothetical protein
MGRGNEMNWIDQRLLDKWLESGEYPPPCPYLRGYYCFGGENPHCPTEVVAKTLYQCEDALPKGYYSRLLNERAKRSNEAPMREK